MALRRRTVIYDDKPKIEVVPDCKTWEDVKMEKIEWLWQNRIPLGQLSMIMSDPGLGKSTLSLMIAAHISQGRPWPDDPMVRCPQGSVLIISCEDDPAAVSKPRLTAAGANMRKVLYLKRLVGKTEDGKEVEIPFDLNTQGIATFGGVKKKHPDLRLIIIDPVSAYMGNINSHNNAEVRAVLDPIAEWAAREKVAILMIHHLNKNDKMRATYRSMGSLAFIAVSRMAWGLAKDKNDSELRLMFSVKANVAPETKTVGFKLQSVKVGPELIDTAVVAWEEGYFDVGAEDALSPEIEENLQSTKHKAAVWLKGVLRDGPVLATDIYKWAEEEGICSERTLSRAKKQLDIKSGMKDGKSYWRLF
jgi:putative DNA primase/helicase